MSKIKSQIREDGDYSPFSSRKIDSINVAQFEYTAGRMFTYGSIVVGLILFWASVAYMGTQQLKK